VSKGRKGGFGGGGRPMGGGGGGGGMMGGGMMQQIQKMQQEMVKAQEALETETLEVTSGGGAVTIVITGHQRIKSLTVKPEVVDPEDVEMLQDLLLAAVNSAIEQSQTLAKNRMEAITGGIDIPGF
jgi:DNA-binding YbaB/EbfC family protein